jgi:hypothetical protein
MNFRQQVVSRDRPEVAMGRNMPKRPAELIGVDLGFGI